MTFTDWLVDRIAGLFVRTRPPKLQDPRRFDGHGIAFEYPRNWKIDDVDSAAGAVSVFLGSAMGGVCCVTVLVPNTGMSIDEYAEGAVAGFQEGVGDAFRVGGLRPFRADGWALDPISCLIAGKDRDGIRLEVTMRGLGEAVVSRFEIHHVDEAGYAAFVLVNATDAADWETECPGFDLLRRSLAVTPGRAAHAG